MIHKFFSRYFLSMIFMLMVVLAFGVLLVRANYIQTDYVVPAPGEGPLPCEHPCEELPPVNWP